MAKKRTFNKLREHLTSTELDEKASVLENISRMPTNNTAFVFGADPSNPQGNSFETIIDGETDETDYNVGESPTSYTEARDTTGLFNAGGNHAAGEYVKTVEPPGDTSYILGPMAAMYYTWSYPWTMIGYIRESDRRMVNLARIDGKLSDWDQSSGFSSYGQLTLDQAKWFFNIQKAFGNSNDPDTYSYRAYYPGPPSQTADAYGRYPCILTGVSKQKPNSHPNATPLDKQSGDNYSAMQAQADKGSGFISFKPDLNWYKKNKKKPKDAPFNWEFMSDDEKANWISQNQPEERFDYQDGRFEPNQNNAQSNRVVNPYSIFDPSQDPLADIPISQQFGVDPQTSTTQTPNNPDTVNAAVGHGLSKERAESMTATELNRFVAQQNALQADIDKHSADQKKYEKQARDIAIGYGVDVVTTIFGGPILKGAFKGIQLGYKGIKALTTAKKVSKVATAIQKTEKISKAAAVTKATNLVNKANKVNQSATKTNNAIKAAQTSQKANIVKTTQLPKQPLTYKGPANVKSGTGVGSRRTFDFPKPVKGSATTKVTTGSGTKPFKPGPLTGKSPTGKPLTTAKQTPSTKPGFKPGPLTGKSPTGKPLTTAKQTPVPPKTTGTAKVTTGSGKTSLKQKMQNYINKGKNQQVPNEDTASLRKLVQNDIDQMGKFVKPASRNKPLDQLTKADFEGGPLPMNLDQLRQFVQGKGGLTWSFSRGTVTGPTPLFRQTPRLIKQGLEKVANDVPIMSGTALIGANELRKGVQGLTPEKREQFISGSKSAIESIVNAGADAVKTAQGTINVISQAVGNNKTSARFFLGYLTGSIKGNAGDFVPEADQESAWKGMKIGDGGVTVGGPMVNIFGGEPLENLKVDGDNAVFEFNFAPKTNKVEFASAPKGRWSPGYQQILTDLEPLTEYMADLSPNFGKSKTDKAIGIAAGAATNVFKIVDKITPDGSKLLGNIKTARDLNGSIKIPLTKLKTLNPDAYEYLTRKNVKESVYISRPYKPSSLSLERKREIFGHLTQPVVLPETKQKTYKVSPGQRYKDKNKKPEKTNFQDMDKLFNKNIGGPQPFKPQERTSWTKDFINQNVIKSQEKMNGVLELIGDGKFALDHAMNDYKKMGAKELEQYWGKNPSMYSFLFNGRKYNVTRKEHIENDSIVFMEDDHGVKTNILQSELNDLMQEQNEKWIEEAYFKSHPVIPEKKESTYELIKRRFLENKKIAPEFPAEPPPEMVNGYHPKFGKRAARYKKLDPASANAMPLTGDPETDEIVRKQKTINKIKSMKKK